MKGIKYAPSYNKPFRPVDSTTDELVLYPAEVVRRLNNIDLRRTFPWGWAGRNILSVRIMQIYTQMSSCRCRRWLTVQCTPLLLWWHFSVPVLIRWVARGRVGCQHIT